MQSYFRLVIALCIAFGFASFKNTSVVVNNLDLRLENEQIILGFLSEGQKVDNDWANDMPGVGCFSADDNKKFNGNQILYSIKMPSHSFLKLSAVSDKDISMYAFQVEEDDLQTIPPEVKRVLSCSVSHNRGNGRKNPEFIQLSTKEKSRRVIFAVAGANKITKGAFELRVELTSVMTPKATVGY